MKFLLAITAVLLIKNSWGQMAYRPIPETNATWIQAEYLIVSHEDEIVTTVVYTVGDTVVNGQTYIKLGGHGMYKWIDGFGSQNPTNGGGPIPYGTSLFRQDIAQKKVFVYNLANQAEELLYDFGSLVIGQPYPETMTNLSYPNLLVMGRDSVQLMDGNYYQRWVLGTNSSDSAFTSVIEGVGGTHGFNTPIHLSFEQESHLMCHKVGTQHIYEDWQTPWSPIPSEYSEDCSRTLSLSEQNETNLVIFPNPSSSTVTIQSNQLINYVEIYDLNGQSLLRYENSTGNELSFDLSALQQGVYLVRIVSADGYSIMRQIQVIQMEH